MRLGKKQRKAAKNETLAPISDMRVTRLLRPLGKAFARISSLIASFHFVLPLVDLTGRTNYRPGDDGTLQGVYLLLLLLGVTASADVPKMSTRISCPVPFNPYAHANVKL